ncbi:MAG TPA: hypothetical protein VF666_04980 [Pyrinomonadaceae bacterium]
MKPTHACADVAVSSATNTTNSSNVYAHVVVCVRRVSARRLASETPRVVAGVRRRCPSYEASKMPHAPFEFSDSIADLAAYV